MKSIYSYNDYRSFLGDYYVEKKKITRNFSFRYFSAKAGIKSPVFLRLVIDGKRNLTEMMIRRFITALELPKKQATFFRHMVLFNQAKTVEQKQEHYRICKSMRGLVTEHLLKNDQFDYFNKWYTSVVREIICLYDFQDNFTLIGQCIIPPVTPVQVKKAIELLLRLNMISKELTDKINNTSIFLDNLLNWAKSQMQGIQAKPADINLREISGKEGVANYVKQVKAAAKKIQIDNIIEVINQELKQQKIRNKTLLRLGLPKRKRL